MVDMDKAVQTQIANIQQKPGGMCRYKVRLGSPDEVDAELVGWIRAAYDAAG